MINSRHGFSFAMPIVIVGAVITLVGVPTMIESPVLGIIFMLVGPFFWSSSYGVQIDCSKNMYREYGSAYGVKSGTWQSLDKMPYLTVLRGKSGTTIYSQSNRSTTFVEERYEVCLLNESHRKKVVVKKFETEQAALEYCKTISGELNKKIVTYNPVVSEATRNRRMSRK